MVYKRDYKKMLSYAHLSVWGRVEQSKAHQYISKKNLEYLSKNYPYIILDIHPSVWYTNNFC